MVVVLALFQACVLDLAIEPKRMLEDALRVENERLNASKSGATVSAASIDGGRSGDAAMTRVLSSSVGDDAPPAEDGGSAEPKKYEAHEFKHVEWLGSTTKSGRVQRSKKGKKIVVLKLDCKKDSALLQKRILQAARTDKDEHVVSLEHFYEPDERDKHENRYALELEDLDCDLEVVVQRDSGRKLTRNRFVLHCAYDLVHAVAHIHGIKDDQAGFPHGVVHMDIKPKNFVQAKYNGPFKLIDFDNSRCADEDICVPEEPSVTTNYTSPEMYKAFCSVPKFGGGPFRANKAHDMFCVGLVLWYLYSEDHVHAFETDAEAAVAFNGVADPVIDVERFHCSNGK